MKCPKCDYLGFETGDRCRNCGYDFSLLAGPDASPDPDVALHDHGLEHPPVDLPLNLPDGHAAPVAPLAVGSAPTPSAIELAQERPASHRLAASAADAILRVERADEDTTFPSEVEQVDAPRSQGARRGQDRSLPLFTPAPDDEDDTPLVRLPPTPRAPLSVRRTAENPRLRAIPRASPPREPEFGFGESTASEAAASESPQSDADRRPRSHIWQGGPAALRPGSAARRLVAALIDYAILLSIDLAVVYFTLRMVSAGFDSWSILPRVPLVLFLALLKVGYFGMFTAMGGQTIGKMAARIRVVTEDGHNPGAAQSVTRTLAGALTALTLGVGFLPALAGEHKALHDRLAHTRVVSLESA